VSASVVGPPCTGVTTQLLHDEESLLPLHAAQEPKLGLDCTKPMVGLKRLSYLGEERRVSGCEVVVASQSWSRSIPYPIFTTSRVGDKLLQQLGLLISGLKDRGDSLSQG
jgi:hypothetical protein